MTMQADHITRRLRTMVISNERSLTMRGLKGPHTLDLFFFPPFSFLMNAVR